MTTERTIMKKKILIALFATLIIALLCACGGEPTPEPQDETVRVMVVLTDGITVTSTNPLDVKQGESAVFDVTIADGYAFESVSAGTYDAETGKLTVNNVTERTTVTFTLESLGYDTNVEYIYVFNGTDKDSTDVTPSPKVKAGTQITLTAGDTSRIFVGWSFGSSYKTGGKIVSDERTYTFRISPDTVTNGALMVYSNYIDSNVYYYDPQGGVINAKSRNMAENKYYDAAVETRILGEKVRVTLTEEYYSFAECACTFWDDGTFTKPGYVLKEYNTKPDGTGESYSLGSKFFTVLGDEYPTLYCIWEKAEESDFSVSDYNMPNPLKNPAFAPDWCEDGVIITSFNSDYETVTVPETVGGKKVIAIAAGAFTNKTVTTLILPKTLQKIEDGAFVGCSKLETLYFPNSIYELSDNIFDEATYSNFTGLYVNSTMAPRYTHTGDGGFAVKLSRFLAAKDDKKVIVISGSSTYQGLGTEYMEALFDGEYTVINFGTTRPRPGLFYLEALSHYTDEDDIFVYAPENSAFMMGEQLLNWRIIRDLEGMNNLYRYVDISNYYGYFSAFSELNRDYNYTVKERKLEEFVDNTATDKNGDYQNTRRQGYLDMSRYVDAYYITFNNRFKSITDFNWNDTANQEANKDYTDLTNPTWTSVDTPEKIAQMNMAIGKARASGAKVYFGFCPADSYAVVEEARNLDWLLAYDAMILNNYDFDGILGSCVDYIYNSKYFYDCAFHVNDYGRAYRTYMLYADICEKLGKDNINGIYSKGTDFDGCLFEEGSDGTPIDKVDFLS